MYGKMLFTVLMEDARNTFQYHKTFEKGGQRKCLFSLSDRTREQPNKYKRNCLQNSTKVGIFLVGQEQDEGKPGEI